jgi:hypothetical protein
MFQGIFRSTFYLRNKRHAAKVILDAGFWILDAFWVLDVGYWFLDTVDIAFP